MSSAFDRSAPNPHFIIAPYRPMTRSFKISVAVRVANRIGQRARELRRDLRDHVRSESFRIHHAEKRARGLRLYAAWSQAHRMEAPNKERVVWPSARAAACNLPSHERGIFRLRRFATGANDFLADDSLGLERRHLRLLRGTVRAVDAFAARARRISPEAISFEVNGAHGVKPPLTKRNVKIEYIV